MKTKTLMNALNKHKGKLIGLIIFLIVSLSSVSVLNSMGVTSIDIKGYGAGHYSKSGWTSFLQSFEIMEDYDIIVDGEGVCLLEDCWAEATAVYIVCESEMCPEITGGDCDICDEDFIELLEESGCRVTCDEERYEWDGTPVTDVSSFYEHGFPNFYARSESTCTGYFYSGTWLDGANKGGCVDFGLGFLVNCGSRSLSSAGDVCEAIGGTWVCDTEGAEITCSI